MYYSFRSQNWREARRQLDAFRVFDSSTNAKASKKRKCHQEEVKNDNSMDYGCSESDLDTLFVPDAVQNSTSKEHIPLDGTDDENDDNDDENDDNDDESASNEITAMLSAFDTHPFNPNLLFSWGLQSPSRS